jgi:hypothetical protein
MVVIQVTGTDLIAAGIMMIVPSGYIFVADEPGHSAQA